MNQGAWGGELLAGGDPGRDWDPLAGQDGPRDT